MRLFELLKLFLYFDFLFGILHIFTKKDKKKTTCKEQKETFHHTFKEGINCSTVHKKNLKNYAAEFKTI